MTVVATDAGEAQCSVGVFAVKRPCYLVDLSGATGAGVPAISKTTSLQFQDEPQINGRTFSNYNTFLDTFTVGTVNQINLNGNDEHPFHMHVNSYQIANAPTNTLNGYFQQGDWHDTLLALDETTNVRFQTDIFTGKMVFHCHILEHEDEGMMQLYNLVGTEGARFDGASIDATCYSSAFNAATNAPTITTAGTCDYTPRPSVPPNPPNSPPPPPSPPAPPYAPTVAGVANELVTTENIAMLVAGIVLVVIAAFFCCGGCAMFGKARSDLRKSKAAGAPSFTVAAQQGGV